MGGTRVKRVCQTFESISVSLIQNALQITTGCARLSSVSSSSDHLTAVSSFINFNDEEIINCLFNLYLVSRLNCRYDG